MAPLLVSVIVPVRNAERYVSEALASILDEKKTPIEVIVVNDKSSDRSLERVSEFRDARIRVIEGPGRGYSASMNAGLAAARGSIIMECDADDLYPKHRIKQQVRWLDSHPEHDAVCGSFSTIDHKGDLIAHLECGADPADITHELIDGKVRTHLCTYAIRSPLIVKVGSFRGYFESGGDIDFQLRLGEVGRIAYVPENCYFYRLHGSSITHTQPTAIREFFGQKAYEFQLQRRRDGLDDLQRGCPPPKPDADVSRVHTANEHVQEMLLGRAWREHRARRKAQSLRTGLRALMTNPMKISVWRSVLALALKSPRGSLF